MNKLELFDFVFNDGEEYTNFYFNNRRNKVVSYQINLYGNTIALVNVVDIQICSDSKKYKTALITGVCTHPDYRHQGVMQKLLLSTLDKLKNQNYDFAILSPKDDNYYKKYAFKSLVKGNQKKIISQQNNDFSTKNATKIDIKLIFDLYKGYCTNKKYYQYLSNDIICDLIDEFSMQGSSIQIILQKDIPIGWIATESNKIELAILPDLNILQNLKQLDGYYYFEQKFDGEKDLFQIKYLKNEFESIDINSMLIINKY